MRRFQLLLTHLVFAGAAVATVFVLAGCKDDDAESKKPAYEVPLGLDPELLRGMSRLGAGFLVWERKSKTGDWEIWSKKLIGGKERRLVAPEPGRDHFCPKISPDGKLLAYMSYPKGKTAYPFHQGRPGVLCLMDIKTRRSRVLVPEARSYAEDRAVTWLDARRLCFIDNGGYSQELNVETGAMRKLIKQPHDSFGYLVSPDLKHATTGSPEFALYDAASQSIRHQQRLGGCQPYFTQDGAWGYWMHGAGGPLKKIRLATREMATVLEKDDERLHGRRNYVYFPMISPCQQLLAFAASEDNHNHFDANYDIYVAHVHPQRLEIIGVPVRYTKYSGNDRFPDVYREELPLGTHYVEGATDMEFAMDGPEPWEWHITGGVQAKGNHVRHTFTRPGEYWVEVRPGPGKPKKRGYIHVAEARPPMVMSAQRDGRDGVIVDLDEPVEAGHASVKMASGGEVASWELVQEGLSVRVKLPEKFPAGDALVLAGFRDKAQHPNTMPPTPVEIPTAAWPASDDGLVFVWETAQGRTKLPNGSPCIIEPYGLAFWNERGAMKLRGGWFDAPDAGELVSEACRKTHQITVELVITPEGNSRDKTPRHIITLATNDENRNLTIGQQGNRLILWMRTPENGPAGDEEETELALVENQYPHHVVMAYAEGRLAVYVDGQEVFHRSKIRGDFSNWETMKLRLGASSEGGEPWRGLVERVLIYSRALDKEEVSQHANSSILAAARHSPVKDWVVTARLVEASPTPPLEEFQPYTEALVRHLYEVLEVHEGEPLSSKQINVTHWSWMGGLPLSSHGLKAGDTVRLRLHRKEDHPELENLFVKDDLLSGFDAPSFHDAGEWESGAASR